MSPQRRRLAGKHQGGRALFAAADKAASATRQNHHLQARGELEYGVRAPVFYGNLREKTGETVFHEYLHEACFVLTEISENLWKPPGVYEIM